jgi:membrane-associated protein
MEALATLVDVFLHLDRYLNLIIDRYQAWTYLILFLIVFCETGLVIMPLLPGDSLLFAAGALAATGSLGAGKLMVVFSVAAILGDAVNYAVGAAIGPRVFQTDGRFLKRKHLLHTQAFYERHGGKTIVLARFVPIVRTFAPFVAGVGRMNYGRFASYNVGGALLWSVLGVGAGYLFGNIPVVKNNFSLVLLGIVGVSVLPAAIEAWRQHRAGPTLING